MWRVNCTPVFCAILRDRLFLTLQTRQQSQAYNHISTTMRGIGSPANLPLGSPLPPNDIHVRALKRVALINANLHFQGVGVHLPEWRDTVGWAARDGRVVDVMRTGYPRFFVPRVVDKLAERVVEFYRRRRTTVPDDKLSAILFPTRRYTEMCLQFLARQASPEQIRDLQGIAFTWKNCHSLLVAKDRECGSLEDSREGTDDSPCNPEISAVLYPATLYPVAKAFWQHTGFGMSSRQATYWLQDSLVCSERDPETAKDAIRTRIADGQSLSDLQVDKNNVLLYPTGMTAITETASAIKRLCQTNNKRPPAAAIFG